MRTRSKSVDARWSSLQMPAGIGIRAHEARLDLFESIATNVKKPYSFGSAEPLVRAGSVEVDVKRGHVERKHSHALRSVHADTNLSRGCQCCDFCDWEDLTRGARSLRNGDHAR